MKVDFKSLQDYLNQYGYPYNEMMDSDEFEIPDQTAYEYLMTNIRKFEDIDAMTFFGRKITYSEFTDAINKTANAMKGIGLSDGDRVAALVANTPEAAYLQYGTSKIGAVPSNIDPRTTGRMMLNYIKNEKIKGIVVVDVMYNTAILPIEHEIKEEFGIDKIIIVPADSSVPSVLKGILALKKSGIMSSRLHPMSLT